MGQRDGSSRAGGGGGEARGVALARTVLALAIASASTCQETDKKKKDLKAQPLVPGKQKTNAWNGNMQIALEVTLAITG